MGNGTWMLYGANGYTGELIAEEAAHRGLTPILAGRREAAVRPLAERLGFEYRIFSLDTPDHIAAKLAGVDAVVLAAGPFSATSAPMVDACMATKTHYLDITGEIAVFEACHGRDDEAKQAGIAVIPGVGFDVVPSDCLAASLREALPAATHLELAFAGGGSWSRGTAKTMIEGMGDGGAIRKDGVIKKVPPTWKTLEVPFRDKPRSCVSIPWGDVSTAFYSTEIPNIIVYMHMPERMAKAVKVMSPLMPMLTWKPLQNLIKAGIDRAVTGPDEITRERVKTQMWGRVVDDAGNAIEGTLITPEGYKLTAECAVESVRRVLSRPEPGALTPSMAFGAKYITTFKGCDMQIDPGDEPARKTA
jgi:short subunit dehydrogenase-like uncharacterized protein